jgi:hypothetical protein
LVWSSLNVGASGFNSRFLRTRIKGTTSRLRLLSGRANRADTETRHTRAWTHSLNESSHPGLPWGRHDPEGRLLVTILMLWMFKPTRIPVQVILVAVLVVRCSPHTRPGTRRRVDGTPERVAVLKFRWPAVSDASLRVQLIIILLMAAPPDLSPQGQSRPPLHRGRRKSSPQLRIGKPTSSSRRSSSGKVAHGRSGCCRGRESGACARRGGNGR